MDSRRATLFLAPFSKVSGMENTTRTGTIDMYTCVGSPVHLAPVAV